MTALAVVAAVLVLLGLCAVRGWSADSRDPVFSAGRLTGERVRQREEVPR